MNAQFYRLLNEDPPEEKQASLLERQIIPLQMESFTPDQIHSNNALGRSSLYTRLKCQVHNTTASTPTGSGSHTAHTTASTPTGSGSHTAHTTASTPTGSGSHTAHTTASVSTGSGSHTAHTTASTPTGSGSHTAHTTARTSTGSGSHTAHTTASTPTGSGSHTAHTTASVSTGSGSHTAHTTASTPTGSGSHTATPLQARPQEVAAIQPTPLQARPQEVAAIQPTPLQARPQEMAAKFYIDSSGSDTEELDRELPAILKEFCEDNLDFNSNLTVIARRKNIFKSACVALSRGFFEWHKTPNIKFVGEMGEDYGGPRRAFFRLLMIELQSNLGIFEGKPGQLLFSYNQKALEENKFYTAGRLMAWSIIHNGQGMRCLNKELFMLMCGQKPDLSTFDELISWKMKLVASMIQQFTTELNSCGQLWEVVLINSTAFLPMITNTRGRLTRHEVRDLFSIVWSEPGSNRRDFEEDTFFQWECWLMLIQEEEVGISFEDVLVFVTAAETIPPLGF
ncbi:hypothetical protein HF521_015939 [Silurus meridionalis]|uniref:HECT domain-containing protein n=1 Tax=Silurus meridionalis TaxID=175797 RepID=A0A8T0BPT1_SILME|nr:hypothetical protein HF521_015939 [Silurus meridionalis]